MLYFAENPQKGRLFLRIAENRITSIQKKLFEKNYSLLLHDIFSSDNFFLQYVGTAYGGINYPMLRVPTQAECLLQIRHVMQSLSQMLQTTTNSKPLQIKRTI